jgi:hypothetical protein
MNEKIIKLAEQCTSIPNHLNPPVFDQEKFAELIVEECIGVVEGGRFLHDQAPTALFAKECGGAIKRHFGVEE